MFKLTLLLSFLLLAIAAGERKIEIDPWEIPSKPYRGQVAFPGEMIVFNYTSPHDVWLLPSGNCSDLEGAVVVGDAHDGEDYIQAMYTIGESDVGETLTFICGVTGHCDAGQIIEFEIKEIPEVDFFYPQWNIGNAPYAEVDAYNGQTIGWEYGGSHNVYIFPAATDDEPCDAEDAIVIGDTGTSSIEYTLTEGMGEGCNATELYFVCYAKSELKHCGRGQYVKFNVYPTEDCIMDPCDGHDSHDMGHDSMDECHDSHDEDGAIGGMTLKWTILGMVLGALLI